MYIIVSNDNKQIDPFLWNKIQIKSLNYMLWTACNAFYGRV